MKYSITVGIPTYKRPDTIKLVTESLLKQTIIPNKIIIFDSSEDNKTELVLKELISHNKSLFIYKHIKKRVELPKARNKILDLTKTEIITFLDDDAVPKEKFIETIIWCFKNISELEGATGPSINVDKQLKPLEKIIYDNKNRTKIYPWGEIRTDTRKWIPNKYIFCDVMIGCNQSYKTITLKKIGGFDEKFRNPSFREETDVQLRIKKTIKNSKFVYHPNIYVHHIIRQEGGIEDVERNEKKYFYLAAKNHKYFVDKHFSKILSRLSWLIWSRNPPAIWLAFFRQIIEKKQYIYWHKGLWSS